MRGVERARELLDEEDRVADPEAAALQNLLEVRAADVAHGDVQQTVGLARVVDRDDVRMVDRRRDVRLAHESLAELLVPRQLGREELQRDLAAEPYLLGDIDDAHAAPPEDRLDPEAGDLGPDPCVCRHLEEFGHYRLETRTDPKTKTQKLERNLHSDLTGEGPPAFPRAG